MIKEDKTKYARYQIVVSDGQKRIIKKLFFDLRQLTEKTNGELLIEALESWNNKYEV